MNDLAEYKGPALTIEQQILKKCFEKSGGFFRVTGSARKTIRLIKRGRNYGAINSTVNSRQVNGVMCYRSSDDDSVGFRDHCPKNAVHSAEALFVERYKSKTGWKINPENNPRNLQGNLVYYLVITDLPLATKVCECEKEYKEYLSKIDYR
jgi:hypothetical protein